MTELYKNKKTVTNMEEDNKSTPVCPECGSTDIEILDDEGVAICNHCLLEWPYNNEMA